MSSYEDFTQISKFLTNMDKELIDGAKKTIKEESQAQAKAVKSDAPVRQSGYSKGKGGKTYPHGYYRNKWTSRKEEESAQLIKYRVRNIGDQRSLAHLLEFGHKLPQGGRARPYKHLVDNKRKTEQEIEKKFERLMEDVFK